MADQFKKLSDIDYTTVTKDKLNSYYKAAVKKFGEGSKEASEYGKAMAKAYQVNKGVMPKAKSPAKKPKAETNQQQTRTPTKPTTPSNTRRQRQPGSTGGRGKAPSGTYGKSLPSNPKLKSQPKTKTKSKLRRGSGLGGREKPTMFNLTAMLREFGGVDPKTGKKIKKK